MQAIVTYAWEKETWPEFEAVKMNHEQAARFLRKAARHFKVTAPGLANQRGNGSATYSYSSRNCPWVNPGTIRVSPRQGVFGTVVHEFSHHLAWIRWGEDGRGHRRKFKRELKRVYTFAKKFLPNAASHATIFKAA
jgi:hypothetical protein